MNSTRIALAALLGVGLMGAVSPAPADDPTGSARPAGEQQPAPPLRPVDFPRPAAESQIRPHVRAAQLYKMACAGCHGETGAGDGPVSHMLLSPPRNFTQGSFKLRSTPSGSMPTSEDLARTLNQGMPGTDMKPHAGVFSPDESAALVQVIRRFSGRSAVEPTAARVVIPPRPPMTSEQVARGRTLFEKYSCSGCHGLQGRGNGPWAPLCVDRSGRPAPPRDFTLPHQLRSGSRPEDIYRTLMTGLDGTPMIALGLLIEPDDLWALVYYVRSISHQPSIDLIPLPGGD